MAFKTITRWNNSDITPANADAILAKAVELTATGVTDGVLSVSGSDRTRIWNTEEAANGWVAFVNSITPGPISAVVEAV